MSCCIFEIFSEEIPATLQKKIVIDYKQFCEKTLKTMNISYNDILVGITLNRLVLKLDNCNITKPQLKELINIILTEFSTFFPRTMSYPQSNVRWLRPIRNIFACIDNDVLIDNFYGLNATNIVYTQKFNTNNCSSCSEYFDILKNEKIEINYNKRLEFVIQEIKKENKDYHNQKLVEEIAGMSEYCIKPMLSSLDKKFNILPFELIELVLRENQRYVVFRPDQNNEIKFLIFGDKITENDEKRINIIKGHEKVVNARLDDAIYYWQLDEKIKNDKQKLQDILYSRIFVDNITWKEYLQKQEEYATKIIKDKVVLSKVIQLINDTKLDLATGVVEEFPELQGIIGEYYFKYDFNPYYLNKDNIKNEKIEVLYFYLIDRITYIQTMYQQGKQPTGSGDKYKVKSRMDDVVLLFVNGLKEINCEQARQRQDGIRKLFLKRYQKYIEDTYCNVENIKKFAEMSVKTIENVEYFDLSIAIKYYQNKDFMKTYKRILGYIKNVSFEETDDIVIKAKELIPNENDLSILNKFLDENKIEENIFFEKVLKYIVIYFFQKYIPEIFVVFI